MTGSWEHAYRACSPRAAAVLRAVAILDLAVVSSPAIGAAVEVSQAELDDALVELVGDGWLDTAHAVVERARVWLRTRLVGEVEQGAAIIRRFAELHTAAAGEDWVARHHGEILAAVRACDRSGLRHVGAGLALATWPFAGPPWWAELAGAGEALAIAERDAGMLADLLHRSALRYAAAGERLRAEEQWVRALAIVRRSAKDHDREEPVLTGLSALYRDWGRLGKALDTELGLVDLRREAGDPVALAEALAGVADTMRAAGRVGSAAEYLGQADAVITGTADTSSLHARILTSWGRALWDLGELAAARRQWSRALAMLVDIDDEAADEVRALLAD